MQFCWEHWHQLNLSSNMVEFLHLILQGPLDRLIYFTTVGKGIGHRDRTCLTGLLRLTPLLCFGAFILSLLKLPLPRKVISNKNNIKTRAERHQKVKLTTRKSNAGLCTASKVKSECCLPLHLSPGTCTPAQRKQSQKQSPEPWLQRGSQSQHWLPAGRAWACWQMLHQSEHSGGERDEEGKKKKRFIYFCAF